MATAEFTVVISIKVIKNRRSFMDPPYSFLNIQKNGFGDAEITGSLTS